ncbi:MAG: hypothetical protein P9M03_01820 [Candidatus Theseobacter exili]|nr:hypothetical protein [Candidatus Theseobacter exili]
MNDKKIKIKMTDTFSIGQLRADGNPSASINFRWTEKKEKPARKKKIFYFLPAQASTFQVCFGSVYFSKVKAKLKRACPHPAKKKHQKFLVLYYLCNQYLKQGINAVLKVKIVNDRTKKSPAIVGLFGFNHKRITQ